MMMKSVFWWRKPEYPEETTDLRQVTDETFHTYGLCPVRGLNLGRSGVKQSELRRDESGALAHRATAVQPFNFIDIFRKVKVGLEMIWSRTITIGRLPIYTRGFHASGNLTFLGCQSSAVPPKSAFFAPKYRLLRFI